MQGLGNAAATTLERLAHTSLALQRTQTHASQIIDIAKGVVDRHGAGVLGEHLTSIADTMDEARLAFDAHRSWQGRNIAGAEGRAAYEQAQRSVAELGTTLQRVSEGDGAIRSIPRLKGEAVRATLDAMPHIESINAALGWSLTPFGLPRVGGNALALDASTHARRFALQDRHLAMARTEVHEWASIDDAVAFQRHKRQIEGMNPPPGRPY